MYEIYDNWPKIARDSLDITPKILETKGIDHIIFAGMGGSGSIGDVISSIFIKRRYSRNGDKRIPSSK